MKINLNGNIPDGFALLKLSNQNYYAPMDQLSTILDLRHTVFDKLQAVPKLTKATRSDIKNLFSHQDIQILKNILNNHSLSITTYKFIQDIITKNMVSYLNAPFDKVNEIMRIPNVQNICKSTNT